MISYKCSECNNVNECNNSDVRLSGKEVVIWNETTCNSCQAVHGSGTRQLLANLDQARAEVEKQLKIFDIELGDGQTVDDFF